MVSFVAPRRSCFFINHLSCLICMAMHLYQVVFLYCCPDCPTNAIQMGWAIWVVRTAMKKDGSEDGATQTVNWEMEVNYQCKILTGINHCCRSCMAQVYVSLHTSPVKEKNGLHYSLVLCRTLPAATEMNKKLPCCIQIWCNKANVGIHYGAYWANIT